MNRFQKRIIGYAAMAAGIVVFVWLGSVLPRTTHELFASPDETAVMVFARSWTWQNGFSVKAPLPEELVSLASLHPRSMVRQGDYLVPVGFLGMLIIVSLAESIYKGFGSLVSLMLVCSSLIPLWLLTRRFGTRVSVVTLLAYASFPTVLLYVNRGLFPNLPVVALTIWSVWAVELIAKRFYHSSDDQRLSWIAVIIGGLSLGLALLIRPVEAIWIFPWLIWMWMVVARQSKSVQRAPLIKRIVPLAIGIAIVLVCCTIGVLLSMKTYPFNQRLSDQPVIGYLLHDQAAITSSAVTASETAPPSWKQYIPFGIHPRVMWTNIKTYLLGYLGIWIGIALLGAAVAFRKRRKKEVLGFLLPVGWMMCALLLFYGQSSYADNIRGTVSIGNSFLRYMLPMVPVIAFGIAMFVDWLFQLPTRGKAIAYVVAVFVIVSGVSSAYARDEEGILQTRHELNRYVSIRSRTESSVSYPAIIVSERSDKIFASGAFITASPIPNDEAFALMFQTPYPAYLFHRTFTDQDDPLYVRLRSMFGEPFELFRAGNESFYEIQAPAMVNKETISP